MHYRANAHKDTMTKTIKPKATNKGKLTSKTPAKDKIALVQQMRTLENMCDAAAVARVGKPVRVLYCTRTGAIGVYEGVIVKHAEDANPDTHLAFELTKGDSKGELRTLRYDRMICIQTAGHSFHATI